MLLWPAIAIFWLFLQVTTHLLLLDRSIMKIVKYLFFSLCLLSLAVPMEAQDSLAVSGIDDMAGKRVCTLTGSVQELYLSNNYPEAISVLMETIPDEFLILSQGKADAIIVSNLTWKLQSKNFKELVCVCDTILPTPVGVAFNKDRQELREKFNSFLKDYLHPGTIDSLYNAWAYNPETEMPVVDPDSCYNGRIVVATAANNPPYRFIKDGRISGIELEMVARFAMKEHLEIVFEDMSFHAIIPFLKSGKADMAASTICISEERRKSVDFSDPWIYEASALITRYNDNYHPASEVSGEQIQESFWESIIQSFKNNVIEERRYMLLVNGLVTTLLISLFSGLLGTLLGILLCWGSMHKNRFLSKSCNLFIEFMRWMPQVVFLMIMFYVVFGGIDISSMIVAIISFALCFGAYTSVVFRSTLQGIDKGQMEASLSIGFTRFKAFWYVILPQLVRRVLPVYQGEFIGLVKATSIVGYIAVFDLTKAGDVVRSRTYEAFFPLIFITIIYFAIIWLLSLLIKGVDHKTKLKRKRYCK